MNIVIGLFVIVSAFVLKNIYKVKGKVSGRIFNMCMVAGVFMLFSVQTFGNAVLIAMTVAEVLLCTLLLGIYRAQLVRECAAVRRRKAERRHSHEAQIKAQRAAVRAKHQIPQVVYKPYAA